MVIVCIISIRLLYAITSLPVSSFHACIISSSKPRSPPTPPDAPFSHPHSLKRPHPKSKKFKFNPKRPNDHAKSLNPQANSKLSSSVTAQEIEKENMRSASHGYRSLETKITGR
jgi:hypothetical protein